MDHPLDTRRVIDAVCEKWNLLPVYSHVPRPNVSHLLITSIDKMSLILALGVNVDVHSYIGAKYLHL